MGNILPIRTGDGPDDPLAYEHPDDVPQTVRLQTNPDGSYSVLSRTEDPSAADVYRASLRSRAAAVCGV
ncbi:MAG: hypothetical protein PHS73_00655 [Candidatus Peribacteraceae bacterium]|nr:hypothetical protein [Candidatus Peribacteraceae bacterium]